jgi:hypothetical protein
MCRINLACWPMFAIMIAFLVDLSLCVTGLQSCPLVMRLDSGVGNLRDIELISVTIETKTRSSDQPK